MIQTPFVNGGGKVVHWGGGMVGLDGLEPSTSVLSGLFIDELGFVPLSLTGAGVLFEVFSQRYGRGSILVTTNLPSEEWTEVFGSQHLTGALLDRFTHPTSTSWR